ncbi:MAG: hypothetical protein EKK46_16085 [Rhodocyclaceae bacterium]|nr:MAG: hypothetical protein EKK46_16085 [Rhodocyclaceae bacterium]
MNSSSRDTTPAEQRAAAEAAARARLDQGKQALEALRVRELADAEALAMARIRIQTDQNLAKQSEALREAERKAEMTAIERRSADLDAVKAAQHKTEVAEEARLAADAKRKALEAAAAAAEEKVAVLKALALAQIEQRRALAEMKIAARNQRHLRWRSRWLAVKLASPFKAGAVMLLVGVLLGLGGDAWVARRGPMLAPSPLAEDASGSYDDHGAPLRLRLEQRLRNEP